LDVSPIGSHPTLREKAPLQLCAPRQWVADASDLAAGAAWEWRHRCGGAAVCGLSGGGGADVVADAAGRAGRRAAGKFALQQLVVVRGKSVSDRPRLARR